jgi:hypothetical protein
VVKLKPGDGLVRRKKIYTVTAKRTQDLNTWEFSIVALPTHKPLGRFLPL